MLPKLMSIPVGHGKVREFFHFLWQPCDKIEMLYAWHKKLVTFVSVQAMKNQEFIHSTLNQNLNVCFCLDLSSSP